MSFTSGLLPAGFGIPCCFFRNFSKRGTVALYEATLELPEPSPEQCYWAWCNSAVWTLVKFSLYDCLTRDHKAIQWFSLLRNHQILWSYLLDMAVRSSWFEEYVHWFYLLRMISIGQSWLELARGTIPVIIRSMVNKRTSGSGEWRIQCGSGISVWLRIGSEPDYSKFHLVEGMLLSPPVGGAFRNYNQGSFKKNKHFAWNQTMQTYGRCSGICFQIILDCLGW